MNRIDLDQEYCKGCHLCIAVCPKKVLEVSAERNAKGYLVPFAPRLEECSGCLLCEMTCPDLAITVVSERAPKETEHAQ